MTETPGSTICCSYCGQTFYLPKDCQEHVRAVHLAFGEVLTLSLEPDDLSVSRSRWRRSAEQGQTA